MSDIGARCLGATSRLLEIAVRRTGARFRQPSFATADTDGQSTLVLSFFPASLQPNLTGPYVGRCVKSTVSYRPFTKGR
jgi:hypothetical protein